MNIIIIRDKLKEAVDIVGRLANESSHLPILKNILIRAEEGKVSLISTNLEIGITYSVLGKIITNGSITIPAASFITLLQNLRSERITLDYHDHSLRVATDNYNAELQTLPSEDYPLIPSIANTSEWIEIDGVLLRDGLRQVFGATQFSEVRQQLNVILCTFSLDTIILVGSDSARLAEKTFYKNQFKGHGITEGFSLLIPLKTAQELIRIIKDKEIIKIFHDENQLLFESEQFTCISRRAEGNFPDYKAIIPNTYETEVIINREEFIYGLKLTSSLTYRNKDILLKTHEDKKAIELYSHEEGVGKQSSFVSAKIKGRAQEISFNIDYLLSGLKEISTEEVVFNLNSEQKPAILKSVQDSSYFYIVMPILK